MFRLITTALFFLGLVSCHSYSDVSKTYERLKVEPDHLKSQMQNFIRSAPNRHYLNSSSLEAAGQFISDSFRRSGLDVNEQVYSVNGRSYKNITATYGDESLPLVIVGAHYDVCGEQDGADDNASGVIGMLELARLCHVYQPKWPFRIEFVAFNLEEPPFFRTRAMGSYVHAKSLSERGLDVKGMVCLEMIGYFDASDDSQNYPFNLMKLFYPSRGEFIAVIGNYGSSELVGHFYHYIGESRIKVEKLTAPSFVTGVDFSDHRNYWAFDYPAVMVTDTSFFRNPHYHKKSDTIETLNFDHMAEVIKGVYLGLSTWDKEL